MSDIDEAFNHFATANAGARRKTVVFLSAVIGMMAIVIAYLIFDSAAKTSALSNAIQNSRPEPFVLYPEDLGESRFVALTHLKDVEMSQLEAAAWAEATQYIITYERYDIFNQWEYHDEIRLKSSDEVFNQYLFKLSKVDNPLNNLYDTVKKDLLKVKIHSWMPAKEGGMIIRYAVNRISRSDNKIVSTMNYIARVTYEFRGTPLAEEDRRINRYNFVVTALDISVDTGPQG